MGVHGAIDLHNLILMLTFSQASARGVIFRSQRGVCVFVCSHVLAIDSKIVCCVGILCVCINYFSTQ